MSPKTLVLSAFLAVSGPVFAADRILVCLGDSLTAGYGLAEEKAYPALLTPRFPGWTIVNAGVSGDTTAGGLKRVDWILRGQPDAVLVALGANDGLRGVPAAATEANLTAIVRKIKASGAQVYLAGMDLPTNLGADYRAQFKAIFKKVAKAEKLQTLDFLLEGVGGHPQLNLADGMHPNEAGHVKVAANVEAFLRPRLKVLPVRQRTGEGGGNKVLRRRQPLSTGGKP